MEPGLGEVKRRGKSRGKSAEDIAREKAEDLSRLRKRAQELRGKAFWSRFTVELLERLWLRINRENFLRYAVLRGGREWLNRNTSIPERVRGAIRRGAGWARRSGTGEFYGQMQWRLIGECADALGVPMELLIDEDYYFRRWGIAGYRALCEAYRKGISMEELTYLEGFSDHPKYSNLWYYAWHCFFLCRSSFYIGRFHAGFYAQIIRICNERLGVPVGALVGRQLHTTNAVGVFGELSNILAALGVRECALVAAVARALHDHKFTNNGNAACLLRDIDALLGWYLDGERAEEEARGGNERSADGAEACG